MDPEKQQLVVHWGGGRVKQMAGGRTGNRQAGKEDRGRPGGQDRGTDLPEARNEVHGTWGFRPGRSGCTCTEEGLSEQTAVEGGNSEVTPRAQSLGQDIPELTLGPAPCSAACRTQPSFGRGPAFLTGCKYVYKRCFRA